jgi:N-acetylmuramoyl-L-alanine amidase
MGERRISKVILHCSATPDTVEGGKYGFKQINEWHEENGWLDKASGISCGYHYIVRRDGLIEFGRPESSPGSHCRGHNAHSIGICTISTARLSLLQLESLVTLCMTISQRLRIPVREFYGHYEYNSNKTCPGHDMTVFRKLLTLALKQRR